MADVILYPKSNNELVTAEEGLQLVKAFLSIPSKSARDRAVRMVKDIAEQDKGRES